MTNTTINAELAESAENLLGRKIMSRLCVLCGLRVERRDNENRFSTFLSQRQSLSF